MVMCMKRNVPIMTVVRLFIVTVWVCNLVTVNLGGDMCASVCKGVHTCIE